MPPTRPRGVEMSQEARISCGNVTPASTADLARAASADGAGRSGRDDEKQRRVRTPAHVVALGRPAHADLASRTVMRSGTSSQSSKSMVTRVVAAGDKPG
ncbi:hypothetical protein OHR68_41975 [Spirillospora sp. NBC_00431]